MRGLHPCVLTAEKSASSCEKAEELINNRRRNDKHLIENLKVEVVLFTVQKYITCKQIVKLLTFMA